MHHDFCKFKEKTKEKTARSTFFVSILYDFIFGGPIPFGGGLLSLQFAITTGLQLQTFLFTPEFASDCRLEKNLSLRKRSIHA
jgi:hypothetical protein